MPNPVLPLCYGCSEVFTANRGRLCNQCIADGVEPPPRIEGLRVKPVNLNGILSSKGDMLPRALTWGRALSETRRRKGTT